MIGIFKERTKKNRKVKEKSNENKENLPEK